MFASLFLCVYYNVMLVTIKKKGKEWRLNNILLLNEMKFEIRQISLIEMY